MRADVLVWRECSQRRARLARLLPPKAQSNTKTEIFSRDCINASLSNTSELFLFVFAQPTKARHSSSPSSLTVITMGKSQRSPVPPTVWPEATPGINENNIISVSIGNTHISWAIHEGYGKSFIPTLFWR